MRRIILAAVLAAYLAFLLDIALFQFSAAEPRPNWVPFRSICGDWRHGGYGFAVNFLGNIVAFMPIGLIPALIRGGQMTLWQAALFALAVSLTIEAGQYFSGRRVPDVDDLLLNTVGGAFGFLIAARASLRARRG
jgi:glycopeptide antibiotics resistance protein